MKKSAQKTFGSLAVVGGFGGCGLIMGVVWRGVGALTDSGDKPAFRRTVGIFARDAASAVNNGDSYNKINGMVFPDAVDNIVGKENGKISPVVHRDQTPPHTLIYSNLIVGEVYETDRCVEG